MTVLKMIRQMLLDYQENPVPLTPLGYFYLDQMIQYHRHYNEWYNNLGSNHEQRENHRPSPAVVAPPLPPTPISRAIIVEESVVQPTVTQETTVTEGEQPTRPARRLSRVNRLTARPRRLFQEEASSPPRGSAPSLEQLIGTPIRPAPFSRLNRSEASEEEKTTHEQIEETPRRGAPRRRLEQTELPLLNAVASPLTVSR